MYILSQNAFIINRYIYTFEVTEDFSTYPDCEGGKVDSAFYYSFIGCQLDYEIAKALHPGMTLIADKGKRGDLVLENEYTYETLGHKNEEFIGFMCANRYWEKYDYFVKIDEDAFADYFNIVDKNYDLGCIWHATDDNDLFCTGMVFYYSSRILEKACDNKDFLKRFTKHDDLQISKWLVDSMDKNGMPRRTCSLRKSTIIHKQYNSKRLNLFFNPYLKCHAKA